MEREVSAAPLGRRLPWLFLVGAAVLAVLLVRLPYARWADAQVHDRLTAALPDRQAPAQVVVIDIDEASLAELGPWPWPRPLIGRLIERLRERGVRVQVWDALFPDSAPGDDHLQAALTGSNPHDTVLGQVLVTDPAVNPAPRSGLLVADSEAPDLCSARAGLSGFLGLASTLQWSRVGHLSATPDPDGRLRRVPAVICEEGRRFPQLTLVAAELLEPGRPWVLNHGGWLSGPTRWLQRGELKFALDEQGYLPIPYHRPHSAWPAVSAARILDQDSASLPLRGVIAIVGSTALGVGDNANTPRHPNAPGVSVHAELLGAALDASWVRAPRLPEFWALALTLLIGFLLLVRIPLRNKNLSFLSGLVIAVALPVLFAVFGRLGLVVLPIAAPASATLAFVLTLLLLQSSLDRQRARRLVTHLESFLPSGLAKEIVEQNPSGESLGKPCTGVLLAVRVVGLERWVASVDSLQALGMVHALNTLAEKNARRHGGALEHVQGETLLIAWSQDGQPQIASALATARELLTELSGLLEANESQQYPLGARAAIEVGAFLLGVAGSRASRRPLLLGPAADIVLAMLALSDELASPLLVGQRAAESGLGLDGSLHSVGRFLLPDRAKPHELYRATL